MATQQTTPKTRTIDPAIAELRKQHAEAVAKLQAERRSAATLKTITDKLLPKLSIKDLNALAAELNKP